MTWHVETATAARKELKRMGKSGIAEVLSWFEENVEGQKSPEVSGSYLTGNLRGVWRYKVKQWRALADIDFEKHIVTIYHIGWRENFYTLKR